MGRGRSVRGETTDLSECSEGLRGVYVLGWLRLLGFKNLFWQSYPPLVVFNTILTKLIFCYFLQSAIQLSDPSYKNSLKHKHLGNFVFFLPVVSLILDRKFIYSMKFSFLINSMKKRQLFLAKKTIHTKL
jgi:hypothetical protein